MKNITRALLFLLLLPGLVRGQELTRSTAAASTGPINASNITTGTLPDGRLSANVVTLNGAMNLLNKTLTSPTINGGVISGLTSFGVSGNGTFDSGSGTNSITIRAGSISHNGTSFNFSNSGTFAGQVTAIIMATSSSSLGTTGGTTGIKWQSPAFTGNDPTTASGGTAAFGSNFSLGAPTITATNTNVTTSDFANLLIYAPVAGTNQTITRAWGLYNLGRTYLGGDVIIPNRNTVIGTATGAGVLNFARGGDGSPLGNIGYIGTTESAKLSMNANGGSGSLSFGTNGVLDRMTIGSDGNINGTGSATFTGNVSTSGSLIGTAINVSGTRTRNVVVDGPLGTQAPFLAYTNNDPVTAAGTTTPLVVSHGIGIPTYTASNTGQTYTNLVNFYIAGPPLTGTNVSASGTYALWVNSGLSYFGGTGVFNSGLISSTIRSANTSIAFNTSNNSTTWATLSATGLDISSGTVNIPSTEAYKIGNARYLFAPGTGNTFAGNNAGNTTLTGSANHGFGPSALLGLTTGNQNIGIGTSAGQYLNSGSGNVFVGHGAGLNTGVTASSNNVWLGNNAGRNVSGSAYSNTTYIGYDAGNGIPSESNTFRVGAPATPVSATFTGNMVVNGTNGSPVLALTDGATVTWDSNTGNEKTLTLTGTGRTLTITNPMPGAFYTLKIIQGNTGSNTITTYPTNTKWPGGVVPTLTTTVNAVDILTLFYDGTNYNALLTNDFR